MDDSVCFNVDIKLNQFQNDFFRNMNAFRKENLFCDVTLDVNGTHFPCHRFVLSMASAYFRTMFNGDYKESKSDVVVIKEIETEIMDKILNAVYTAQLQLFPDNVYFVLKASHFLQFNAIVNTCVACIGKNPNIRYLIETCVFAKNFDLKNLYEVCLRAIANDFIRWGKTDAITKLPFDIFSSILSKGNFTQKGDEILLLIIKWTKATNASVPETQKILELAKFKSPIIGPSVIAELISNVDTGSALAKNENCRDKIQSDSTLRFNLYVNVVDEKTGAAGCGLLKLNDFQYDRLPTLSNFLPLNSFSAKICKSGSKMYCLESDIVAKKYTFCCWVNSEKTRKMEWKLPENLRWYNEGYDVVEMENMIYLVSKLCDSDIWAYKPLTYTWFKMFEQTANEYTSNRREDNKTALYNYSDWLAVSVFDNVLYIIGARSYGSARCILAFDSRTPTARKVINFSNSFDHEYAAVCCFDGKIAIYGSSYGGVSRNTFCIFDINAHQWLPDIKPMNNGQANRKLVYRDGFIYAIGNSPVVPNEKYNVCSNSWSDIPSIPKRLLVKNSPDMVVSTGNVLYVDGNC